MDKKVKAYLCLSVSMILAGSSVVAGKSLVQEFPVFLASGLSLLIALVVLVPVSLIRYGLKIPVSLKTASILFLQAFTGTFLFRVFLFFGLKHTSAAAGGLITSSAPAIVGLLAFMVLREKLPWNKILGIAFTVIGIVIINVTGASGGNSSSLAGNILVLLAVTGEAMFSILSKITENTIPPVLKTTIVCFFALLCFIPFSIYDLSYFDITRADYKTWLTITYYGLFVTVIAFVLWFRGISETPAGTSAVFSGLMPLSSILFSSLILSESILFPHFLSLFMILLGMTATLKPSAFTALRCSIEKTLSE